MLCTDTYVYSCSVMGTKQEINDVTVGKVPVLARAALLIYFMLCGEWGYYESSKRVYYRDPVAICNEA